MSSLTEHQRPPRFDVYEILRAAGCVLGSGAAVTVGGVAAVATSGCGQADEELMPPPPMTTAAATSEEPLASSESLAPDRLTPEQMADVYANLTPEQQAALGEDYTQEQLMAAVRETPPQIDPEDRSLGLINMEQVQQAIEQATDINDLEQRVNRIYEGDHVVLMRVRNQEGQTITEGWDDLDDSGVINEGADDLLFSLIIDNDDRESELRGQGVNSYYVHRYPPSYSPPGAFWTGFLLGTAARPRYVYVTPPARRVVLLEGVRAYRATPAWSAHRRASRDYYVRVRRSNPRWSAARVNLSPARVSFRHARRGHGHFRPGPPPPSVHITAPTPPSVHVTAPAPPRVHVTAPAPPSVHVHAPGPPRVTIHGGGR